MENASDALIMAGSVLLFVIALTVALHSISDARIAATEFIEQIDRETAYVDGHLYYEPTGSERQVGLDTVITSLYRVYNETYEIHFKFPNEAHPEPLYTRITNSVGGRKEVFELNIHQRPWISEGEEQEESDLAIMSGNEGKRLFFKALLYGENKLEGTQDDKNTDRGKYWKIFHDEIDLPTTPLYDRLKDATIVESAGMYTLERQNEAMNEDVRIITYTVT